MPISVTGTCKIISNECGQDFPARLACMPRRNGFTLLEILLVLVLLSVASVAVISTFPSSSTDIAKQQAERFFQRIQLLNDEALLSGKEFGLHVDEQKSRYDLMQLGDQGWQELTLRDIPYQTQVEDGVAVHFELGSSAWQDKDRLFDPNSSLFDENMFAEQEQGDKKALPAPEVLITSSGEITAFLISFHPPEVGVDEGWRVVAKENGAIVLLAPGERDDDLQ